MTDRDADQNAEMRERAGKGRSGTAMNTGGVRQADTARVEAPIAAHVRHDETNYDALLARGVERRDARDRVRADVDRMLSCWPEG